MKEALIITHSFSGNTLELGELIENNLIGLYPNINIDKTRLNKRTQLKLDKKYDIVFIGTFTWGEGNVHKDMQHFYVNHFNQLKELNIAYFGTGDTQFGENWFCSALDILNSKIQSKYELLKIEQSPRGSQEEIVEQWVKNITRRD